MSGLIDSLDVATTASRKTRAKRNTRARRDTSEGCRERACADILKSVTMFTANERRPFSAAPGAGACVRTCLTPPNAAPRSGKSPFAQANGRAKTMFGFSSGDNVTAVVRKRRYMAEAQQ